MDTSGSKLAKQPLIQIQRATNMDPYTVTSASNLFRRTSSTTALNDTMNATSPARTDSVHSGYKKGNEMKESLVDDETLMEPPTGFFDFLDVDEDEDKPKAAHQQADHFFLDENNVRIKSDVHYPHPIQELVADSEPDFTDRWVPWTKPGYSEGLTMLGATVL